jgi:hypothetical protein
LTQKESTCLTSARQWVPSPTMQKIKYKLANILRYFYKIYRIPILIDSYNEKEFQRLARKEKG